MPRDAYGYLRVSSSGQVQGYGPQRQREDIAAFAAAKGYCVQQWYQDCAHGHGSRPSAVYGNARLHDEQRRKGCGCGVAGPTGT